MENEGPPGDGQLQEAQKTHTGGEGRGDDAEVSRADEDAFIILLFTII